MLKTTVDWHACQKKSSPLIAQVLYKSWYDSPDTSFLLFLEQFNEDHNLNIEYSKVANAITFEVSDYMLLLFTMRYADYNFDT